MKIIARKKRSDFHARSRFARFPIPEEKWGTTRSLACRVLSDRESGNTKTVQKNGKSVGHQATLLSDACDVKNEAEKVTGYFSLKGTKSGKKAQTRWGVIYGTHNFLALASTRASQLAIIFSACEVLDLDNLAVFSPNILVRHYTSGLKHAIRKRIFPVLALATGA